MTRRRPFGVGALLLAAWVAGLGAQRGPASSADNHEANFLTADELKNLTIRAGTQGAWDQFYSLPQIWKRASCVKSVKSKLAKRPGRWTWSKNTCRAGPVVARH